VLVYIIGHSDNYMIIITFIMMLTVVQWINVGSGDHLISQTSLHTTHTTHTKHTTAYEFKMTSRLASVATHLFKVEFLVGFHVNVISCNAFTSRGNETTLN